MTSYQQLVDGILEILDLQQWSLGIYSTYKIIDRECGTRYFRN